MEKVLNNIAVYCGATLPPDKVYQNAASELGTCLARHHIGLVYGGTSEGTMRLVAESALAAGGRVIGVFPDNLPPEWLQTGLTEVIYTHGLAERKAAMLERSDAIIALPGSFGTWDELFDALALLKIPTSTMTKTAGVLNVEGFYDDLLRFIEHSYQTGFTTERHRHLLRSAATPEELLALLQEPILPNYISS
ncbi:MAG: TIGR00730 family Rossman fold protein [Victivallales bacterium]|nr:TIGR00730 family Rossman fold protein [Victivallales bacterium]